MAATIEKWVNRELSRVLDTNKRSLLEAFWQAYYKSIFTDIKSPEYKKSYTRLYQDEVFSLLNKFKEENKDPSGYFIEDPHKLYELQKKIEMLTMHFDEESMFGSTHNIISMLMGSNMESARDFLRKKLTSEDDITLLNEFGQYTIEAIIVYVLCLLFTSSGTDVRIRVASLVEQLESNVRNQAKLLKKRRCADEFSISKSVKKCPSDKKYPIGSLLVEFMENRGMIIIGSDSSNSIKVIKKKKDSYYMESKLYVDCNFDIKILPVKLNLPMIYPPLDWKSDLPDGQKPRSLSDLRGGYLTSPSSDIYDRYKLLSSNNQNNFHIDIKDHTSLCRIMNCLQSQPFRINKGWLQYILDNYDYFVSNGLLMPRFLSYINLNEARTKLRDFYMNDLNIQNNFSYNELLLCLHKDIQQARYESLIFELASAYADYTFYLPAFLDFRGRIYRSGILHFHERDLARSLIVFDGDSPNSDSSESLVCGATSFHYKSFNSIKAGLEWLVYFNREQSDFKDYIRNSCSAKRPFQFLTNMFFLNYSKNPDIIADIPITQDASASAYQIMSYFLMDESIARSTNLIPSENGEIQDIYISILDELKPFIKNELCDNSLSKIICNELTRKMVKGIFMPLIYGKTVMSTAMDIKGYLSQYLTHKEYFDLAQICFKFWKVRYHNMDCLIRLIRSIGWVVSKSGRPVKYNVNYFSTIQDYMIMKSIHIWVYDKLHKKRRKVTLRVSSDERDSKKTDVSTFVNFIHQKDAYIAMKVVENMLFLNAPVYTVHDNFLTTPYYSNKVAEIYSKSVVSMGSPLLIINEFIYKNIMKPKFDSENTYGINNRVHSIRSVLLKEDLMYYLNKNIPDNTSKSERKTWDEKINTIVNSYENYTSLVCGSGYSSPNEGWKSHIQKYNKFQEMILNPNVPKNSVHY